MTSTCTRAHRTPIEALLQEPRSAACQDFLQHCEGCDSCAAELARQRRRKLGARPPWVRAAPFGLGAAALAGAAWLWLGARPQPTEPALVRAPSEPAAATPEPGAAPSPAAAVDASRRLVSGQRTRIASASLPASGPVAFALALAEPSADAEPLRAHVRNDRGLHIETRARIATADRLEARLEVDAELLSPGVYLFEIHTTERSHLPLRRYAIEITDDPAAP